MVEWLTPGSSVILHSGLQDAPGCQAIWGAIAKISESSEQLARHMHVPMCACMVVHTHTPIHIHTHTHMLRNCTLITNETWKDKGSLKSVTSLCPHCRPMSGPLPLPWITLQNSSLVSLLPTSLHNLFFMELLVHAFLDSSILTLFSCLKTSSYLDKYSFITIIRNTCKALFLMTENQQNTKDD